MLARARARYFYNPRAACACKASSAAAEPALLISAATGRELYTLSLRVCSLSLYTTRGPPVFRLCVSRIAGMDFFFLQDCAARDFSEVKVDVLKFCVFWPVRGD